jgi:hypothetical protein
MDGDQATVAKYMAKRRRPPSQGWPLFIITPTPSRRSTCSWFSSCGTRAASFVAGCDSPSQCGMACPSADRGLRLGRASTLLDPGPRVWRCLYPAHPGHGHSRPTGLGGNVLITSSSLASAIFATFSHRTKNTTTRSERTYRCRRTRRFGVMCAEQGACVRHRSSAGYTIKFEFEFPTGRGLAGFVAAPSPPPELTGLIFILLGGLVSAHLRPPIAAVMALASVLGLFKGFTNGSAMSSAGVGIVSLIGIVATVFVATALAAAAAIALTWPPAKIAFRVFGSWTTRRGRADTGPFAAIGLRCWRAGVFPQFKCCVRPRPLARAASCQQGRTAQGAR